MSSGEGQDLLHCGAWLSWDGPIQSGTT